MARPRKNGLDYFTLDVHAGDDFKIELLEATYGLEGFAVWIKLLQKIYKDWFFIQYHRDFGFVFAKRVGIPFDRFEEILMFMVSKGLFNEELFKKYGILTSAAIQDRWLRGCEKRASIRVIRQYWVIDENEVFEGEKLNKISFYSQNGVSSTYLPEETRWFHGTLL